ncbi:helix-turn-helix domain-containing protein [Undibacterium sp. Di27W]|uniref:helix-turn-helix domain-containing protein n=1 Tax=Undibacterium sp. Di27W TaxID=3413036 RepID=UPI003BF1D6C9
MKKFQHLACPQLRPYIDRYWGWESEAGEHIALPQLLPGTGAELYFHYRSPFHFRQQDHTLEQAFAQAHLLCLRQQSVSLSASADLGFIAVRFKIGMLPRFSPIPMKEVADQIVSVEDIWGQPARSLCQQLSYASSLPERLELIQAFLLRQLQPEAPDALIELAMPLLYRQYAHLSIASLAAHFCIGRRQFERRFLAASGQTANSVKCSSRFQHTVRSLMLNEQMHLASVALDHGYYDQAHFIHEFKKFTGSSPAPYLKLARNKTHFYNTSQGH